MAFDGFRKLFSPTILTSGIMKLAPLPSKLKDLNGKKSRLEDLTSAHDCSLLIITQRRHFSPDKALSWVESVNTFAPSLPIYDIQLNLHLIDRLSAPLFRWLFKKSLKDPSRYSNSLTFSGNCKEFCKEMKMNNQFLPFVFVVDKSGSVTFRSVGVIDEEDVSLLRDHLSQYSIPVLPAEPTEEPNTNAPV